MCGQLRRGAVRLYGLKAGCRSNAMVREKGGLWGQQKCPIQLLCFLFLNKNVYSSFIHNSQKLKAIQNSINRRMDKQIMVYFSNKVLLSGKKEWSVDTGNKMDHSYGHNAKQKKLETKAYTLGDSSYIKL